MKYSTTTIVLAIAATSIRAQISYIESDWSQLISAVTSADDGLKSWDGTLTNAIALLPLIQKIGKDLENINSAIGFLSVPVSEEEGKSILNIIEPDVVHVQKLLEDTGSIASKASSVSAEMIVSSLVSSLQPQFMTFIGELYRHAPCDLASTAIELAGPIINSYYAVDSTYGIPTVDAPATPIACSSPTSIFSSRSATPVSNVTPNVAYSTSALFSTPLLSMSSSMPSNSTRNFTLPSITHSANQGGNIIVASSGLVVFAVGAIILLF